MDVEGITEGEVTESAVSIEWIVGDLPETIASSIYDIILKAGQDGEESRGDSARE